MLAHRGMGNTEAAARETELRERLGLGLDGPTQIEAAPTAPLQLTRKGNT